MVCHVLVVSGESSGPVTRKEYKITADDYGKKSRGRVRTMVKKLEIHHAKLRMLSWILRNDGRRWIEGSAR